ncbi:site-specific integrase [Oscillatoria sp. FACHB-1407]|uniref:tyrosine-type recombinase/integrase n=1 Tax=Oscillatoria sp. FACHB-1407 TaxID=2692847 RepID=UPI00168734F5|nr:site-specific integrase [Oscillatoria sp. FACHB-1407]MBD2463381.1 site-specific integrase [Oscillatoria sp. FACHB-1407]
MVQLIKATDKAEAEGLPEGFRFLVANDMRLFEPANLFLYKTCVISGRVESLDTQKTYAEALYDWFQTCEDMGWEWQDITEHELAMYRNRMLTIASPHTGRSYKRNTINGRLGTICRYYSWAHKAKLIDELPFSYENLRVPRSHDSAALTHLNRNSGLREVNTLLLKSPKPDIRAIPIPELQRILQKLGPAKIRDSSDPRPSRDRIVAEASLLSGMRRIEIANLSVSQIPESGVSNEPFRQIGLKITKGGNPRDVYLPQEFISRINWYIKLERAKTVAKARRKARQSGFTYEEPDALFLTQDGSPITRERITRIFADAAEAAGVPNADFHGLRHTYAINLYKILKRSDPAPWKTIQILLGHADLGVTLRTYLKAVEVDEAAISDAIEDYYNEILYG